MRYQRFPSITENLSSVSLSIPKYPSASCEPAIASSPCILFPNLCPCSSSMAASLRGRAQPIDTTWRPSVTGIDSLISCDIQKTVASVGPYKLKILLLGAAAFQLTTVLSGSCSPPNTVTLKFCKLLGCNIFI